MDDQTMNYVVAIIVLTALGVGLISMLFGKIVDLWDAFRVWWGDGLHKAVHYRPVHMSSYRAVPTSEKDQRERRSYAVEQPTEHVGTGYAEQVPDLVGQIGTLSDDELLDILARVLDEDGDPRFAESKIGRFVGGRLEDRIGQVRAVRGNEAPAKPAQRVTPIVGRPTNAKYVGTE